MGFMGALCFQGRVEASQRTILESILFLLPVPFAYVSYLLLLSEAGGYSLFCTEVTATRAESLVMEMERWKEVQKIEEEQGHKQWDFLITLDFMGPSCWHL